jgi:UDP-N-acetyl-D-galactosamine dehydrogenase
MNLLWGMDQSLPGTDYRIAIIGLGYVGLPLAIAFSKKYPVIGFDIDEQRVQELIEGIDRTKEVDRENLSAAAIRITSDRLLLNDCTVYIITVPTPLDEFKQPDLRFLMTASTTVAACLKKGDLVIYESTVYPGCTEEDCVPVLEAVSGLVYNKDFYCGYSPERINPGDKFRDITQIRKVTSGSTPAIARCVDELYAGIISAGTYLAPSIKVAEAAKAIENAQRDVNISFINEVALIFDRMGIDTNDVLDAASTKWNFMSFKPGLVGGHCISVDPYYLATKAISLGYQPKVILSGREVNDRMGIFVAEKMLQLLANTRSAERTEKRVLILGMAFKPNCADTRNTKVIDVYEVLKINNVEVDIFDPWVDASSVKKEFGIELINAATDGYDGIIVAVGHDSFKQLPFDQWKNSGAVIFDTQNIVERHLVDGRL